MYPIYLWITVLAFFLSACGSGEVMTPSPIPPTSPIIADVTPTLIITPVPSMSIKTPPADSSNLDPTAKLLVEKAREHLVKKFGITADQITVFSVESIVWPDAGLGCPQKGIGYAQVETPGYLILLEAGGQVYNYHTDANESVVLCDAKSPGEIFLPPDP